VLRHYEITPAINPETSTGRVMLFFTQAEFNGFNAINELKLPTGPTDAAGKANLLIEKRKGSTTDSTGKPNSYTGTIETINPADNDIVWNAGQNRWEVSFDVTGFSGFFVKTTPEILPIRWISFTGQVNKRGKAKLNWKVQEQKVDFYTVEKSIDNRNYTAIGRYSSLGDGENSYHFTEEMPMKGDALYRIKQTNKLNGFSFSPIVRLQYSGAGMVNIYPNPVKDRLIISLNGAWENTPVIITDMHGRQVRSVQMAGSTQTIDMSGLPAGVYVIRVGNGDAVKVVKE
jgi:hypothetical protein